MNRVMASFKSWINSLVECNRRLQITAAGCRCRSYVLSIVLDVSNILIDFRHQCSGILALKDCKHFLMDFCNFLQQTLLVYDNTSCKLLDQSNSKIIKNPLCPVSQSSATGPDVRKSWYSSGVQLIEYIFSTKKLQQNKVKVMGGWGGISIHYSLTI